MKIIKLKQILSVTLFFLFVAGISNIRAQKDGKNVSTKISYKVDFGPVYPIEGDSYQVVGKVALDDSNNEFEKIGFEVPLVSFLGQNSGYLGWVGNSWDNPDMSFSSTEITKKDDTHYTVKGRLEFRRRTGTSEIDFIRQDTDNEIVLQGNFELDTSDYFIITPPVRQVPSFIPFKVTLVFDKPSRPNDKQISFH